MLPKHLLRHLSPTQRPEAWIRKIDYRINFDSNFLYLQKNGVYNSWGAINYLLLLPLKSRSGAEFMVLVLKLISEHQGGHHAGIWRTYSMHDIDAATTGPATAFLLMPLSLLVLLMLLLMLLQVI